MAKFRMAGMAKSTRREKTDKLIREEEKRSERLDDALHELDKVFEKPEPRSTGDRRRASAR